MKMQLTTIGKIVAYTSGALLGGSLGYALAEYILRKRLEEKDVDAIIDDQNETIRYILDGKSVTKEEYEAWIKQRLVVGEDNTRVAIPTTEKDLRSFKNTKDKVVDYAGITKNIGAIAAKNLGETSTKESGEEGLAPYIISVAEFSDRSENTHIAINYYDADKTLADEHDVKVAIPEELVGPNALSSFGKLSGDPDVVYIRNNKLGLDIEVSRLSKSYDEAVLGLTLKKEKEKEKEKAKPKEIVVPDRERPRRRSRKDVMDDETEEE
jgi:hypothetical protein